MNALRFPLLRCLVTSLALVGILAPLAPEATARTADRLAEKLGHRAAVEVALDAARGAADPQEAFLDAYREATGQDAESVLARLEGEALWMLADVPEPVAVLAATGAGHAALASPFPAVLAASGAAPHRPATAPVAVAPATPARLAPLPPALRPRGP